jgi:imidazolonepropionase-like amidohydrolase
VSGTALLATTIVLRGATLIDGTGAAPVPDSLLVVSDGRIAYAGAATKDALASVPAGSASVAVRGLWIVPGLIDAHVHAESDADLRTMLRWGVTSVRLMAEDVAASERLSRDSRVRGDIPRVFPAAPIFTAKGGWWDQGEPPDANLNRFPSRPAEARLSVRKARALGAREIKLMLDDMAWCRAPRPELPKMSSEVAAALLSEAAAQGVRAIVHAPELADAKAAVGYGATALAHGVLEPIDEETVGVMRRRPVFYVPTMDVFEFLADTRRFVDSVLSDPAVSGPGGLSEATVARYRDAAYASGYRARYPAFENVMRRLPALRENLRRLHGSGVPVALGTDMWAFPGLGVSIEMGLFVEAGLSPLEALRAATQTAARSIGIEADAGTLERGKGGDFLLLSDDPVRKVRNVRKIVAVYKNGVEVSRAAGAAR